MPFKSLLIIASSDEATIDASKASASSGELTFGIMKRAVAFCYFAAEGRSPLYDAVTAWTTAPQGPPDWEARQAIQRGSTDFEIVRAPSIFNSARIGTAPHRESTTANRFAWPPDWAPQHSARRYWPASLAAEWERPSGARSPAGARTESSNSEPARRDNPSNNGGPTDPGDKYRLAPRAGCYTREPARWR